MTSTLLSPNEGRVLGVLIEKQRTVPDGYPLTLNALVTGCNQKSSRDPVLELSDSDVHQALDGLRDRALVIETSGGRAMRYAHNAERVLGVPSQSVALLAALLLRGPQTAGELRINTERLHRFADISTVDAFLHELAERQAGALVSELPRTPGTRETRWTQLLAHATESNAGVGQDPAAPLSASAFLEPSGEQRFAMLAREIAALRDEVAALRSAVNGLLGERGDVPLPQPGDASDRA